MNELIIERISTFNKFKSLKNEWNKLLSQSNNDCLFLRHEWFEVWWQSFGDRKKLLILLASEEGELVGIAPMMQVRESRGKLRILPIKQIRFIQNDESPRADFIIKKGRTDVIRCFLQYFSSIHQEWGIIILKNLMENSEFFKVASDKAIINDLQIRIKDSCNSPFLYTDVD